MKRRPTRALSAPARRVSVVWTERALRDLEAIGDFIARDSPAAAERWVLKLMKAAESVGALPMAGRQVPELGRTDVREKLLRNYRIVYRATEERIEILTVFEGHRRFPEGSGPPEGK